MAAMRELARSKTFCLFGAGSTLQSLVAYGQSAFLGSFFFRNYGPELNRAAAGLGLHAAGLLGLTLGVTAGLSGILGAYMGGKLADRHTAKGPRGLATQAALANLVATPIFILAMLVHSAPLVVGLIFFHSMISSMTYGPLFAVFQSVVQPRTRATAVAIFLLLSSLVGLGVGPLLVGVASDYLSQGLGLGAARGLVWAEVGVTLLGLLGVWYYWRARQYIVGDTVS
jgi:MFS family permease